MYIGKYLSSFTCVSDAVYPMCCCCSTFGALLLTMSDVACLCFTIRTVLIYHVIEWGVPFVCILIVDEALVSPGAAAARNWIPDP